MRNTTEKSLVSLLLCALLIAAAACCFQGCGKTENTVPTVSPGSVKTSTPTVMGEGKTVFTLLVADGETETDFEIHTDEKTVGDALLGVGLIEGEHGAYGLYVKTVNGVTYDYDTDGKYWAFYVNGDYATAGADVTEINENDVYAFRVE